MFLKRCNILGHTQVLSSCFFLKGLFKAHEAAVWWHQHNGVFTHKVLTENLLFNTVSMSSLNRKTWGRGTKTHRLFPFLRCLDRCGKRLCHSRELYYLIQHNNLRPCPLPHPQYNITSLLYLEAVSMWHHDQHPIPAFSTETGRRDETQALILYVMQDINAAVLCCSEG